MALTDNLVSYWKADESSGNMADSVGSNTLTNVGTCTFGTGIINNGVITQRNTKYMQSSSSTGLNPTDKFTLNFWVKWSSLDTGNWNGMVSKLDNTSRAWGTGILNSSGSTYTVLFDLGTSGGGSNGYTVNTTVTTGTWYMWSFVFNGASTLVKIYKNATEIYTNSSAQASCQAGTANLRVGWRNNPSTVDGSNATFDEIGFWHDALSAANITSLYNGGAGLAYPFTTTQISSINGVAQTSVSSYGGVAIASIKSVNGVANS